VSQKATFPPSTPPTSLLEALQPSPQVTSFSTKPEGGEISQGVIVECYKQGSKLKIRAISPGYNSAWNVQFPKHLRQEGARYLVEEVREAKQGGFYRVRSQIEPLLQKNQNV
jgi:hypothetical protein